MRADRGTNAPAPGGTIRHISVVDGLRGIAVLLVVLFHYWQLSFYAIPINPPGSERNLEFIQFAGDLGVELFFFLSAFCLFYPHAKVMYGQGSLPTLRHFYYRRAIKIVPSYVLVLLLCGLFFLDIYPVTLAQGMPGDLALHAVFLHNLFPDTRSSFDLVLWSLGVEVQFYYLFPLLAMFFRRRPLVTPIVLILAAVAFRGWVREEHGDNLWHWNNQLPAYLDVFALGMLAAYLVVRVQHNPAAVLRMRWAFSAIGVTAFVTMLAMFRWRYDIRYDGETELWRSHYRLALAAVFTCITVGSIFAVSWWQKVLANRVLLFLSTISYNLYLWHAVLGRAIKDRGWWESSTVPATDDPHWRWSYSLVGIGASIAVATVITYAFERPLLRHGVRGALRLATSRVRSARGIAPPPTPVEVDRVR